MGLTTNQYSPFVASHSCTPCNPIEPLKVLVACEESQTVTKAFRELGHEAYSCDLVDCSGGHPEWHIKGDARVQVVNNFDLKICFPPCTDLALSGAKWFEKKRLSGQQKESIMFFLAMYNQCDSVENPIGIMNGGGYLKRWFPFEYKLAVDLGVFKNNRQIIHPWMFGDPEQKSTCLWLRNLPPLLWSNTDSLFYNKTSTKEKKQSIHQLSALGGPGSSKDRQRFRSKTFPGIAQAMATQWSEYILSTKLKTA